MNNIFILVFVISLLGIPIFILAAIINRIRKRPAKKRLKLAGISSLIMIISFIGAGATMDEPIPPTYIQLSVPDYQDTYNTNTQIPVNISVIPEDANVANLEYIASGETLTFTDTGVLTGSQEGSFDIHVKSGDITSNTLTINVQNADGQEKAKNVEYTKDEATKLETEKTAAEEAAQQLSKEQATGIPELSDSSQNNDTQKENASVKSGSYDIAGETFQFSDSVRNDVTGNWRLSLIASSKDATEYAINYYNTLFGSDDEIHAIINFSNNTTSKISVLYSGMLDVTIHEYTDNEEHDAKQLFGGTLLNEYWVNTETGEVELIQ